MKKILVMLLVLLGLGMAACSLEGFGGGNNNNKPEHKHSIVEGWKNDSANHWQLCDSCDEKLNLAAHEFSEWEKVEGLDLEIRSCLCGWEEQRNTEPETKDFTVYYYNSLNWETVNAYAWNESGALNGEWPGSAMAAEAEGWYSVTLSVTSLDGVGIIFNNGATQTDDITLASGKVYYYGLNVEGFASKEEALAAYDAEQEVPVVPNTYYLRGSMNGWGTSAPLTVNGDVASIEIEILRTDEFKVACAEWSDKNFGITNGEVAINGGNFKVEKSGLYRVSVINYGTEQETVTIELLKEYQDQVVKNDFYFRGTINSVNHWNTCNETVKFVAGETSATFEVTLAVGDEFKVAVAGDGWTPQYNANNATYEADHIGGTDNFVVKTAGKYKLEITGWGTAEEKLVITLVEASDTPIVPVEKVYTIEINGVSYTLTLDEDATLDTNQTAEYTVTVDSVLKGQTVVVKSNGEAIINIGAHGTGQNVVGNGGEGMSIVNDATNVTVAFKLWQDGGHSLAVSGYEVPVVPEEKVYTVEINGTSHTLALNTDKQDAVEYFVKGVALAEGDTLVVKLNGEDVEATADPYETNNLTSDMKVRTATANAEHGIYVKVSTDSYVVWVDGYTAPVDEDVETVYYLVGDFNEWTASDEYKLALDENDEAQQVLLNVVINANEKFKLIAVQGEKITWLGYSIFEGDTELSISGEGDNDITIGEAGTYNFYYKFADNKLWVSKVDNSGEEGGETPEPEEKIYTIEINGVSHTLVLDEDAVLDATQIAEYTVTIDSVLKDQTVVVKLNGEAIINIGAHGAVQNVSGNGGEGMSIINDASTVVVAFKLWQDGGHSLAISGYVKPAEQESLTVYYFNSNNWDKVSCYTWGTASNITGGWPGKEMTPVEGKTGWYTITLTDDSLSGLSIQFNCGGNTNEINVNVDLSGVNVYYYGKVKTGYASFESVEEAIEAANNQSSSANLFLNCGGSGLWDQAGAWFAVYCWNGSGSEWFEMKDSNGDGIYETNIGEDYENVIFCRMASNKTQLDFSSAWNKTGDLSLPTDGSNLYTISGWGANDGSWSTK